MAITEEDYPHDSSHSVFSQTSTLEQRSVEAQIDGEANLNSEEPEKKPAEPAPPPNGGFTAWLQVAGSFFLYFNCWGIVNSFGVFQTYYEHNPYWQSTASNIAWIGSIAAFLLLSVGAISGPLYDLGYFRTLVAMGTFLLPFGFMMTSLCREYWQILLAQGFVLGIGMGCLWVPTVAILPQYFTTRKVLANGLAAAGGSIGGIVYPIAFRDLQQQIGFPWACRVLGFISLATLLFSLSVMRQRIMPKSRRALWDLGAFREPPYLLYCVGIFLAMAGLYVPMYYIQPYAIGQGLTSTSLGFYLLPILNAGSVFGRIIPNFIGDYTGPMNVLIPSSIATGILALAWIGIHNEAGLIVFAVLYGFFSGAFISNAPVAIVPLTPDLRKLGTRMGQAFFVCSFGLLMGTPVAGAILSSRSWLGVQLFSGLLAVATATFLIASRTAKVGWKLIAKA